MVEKEKKNTIISLEKEDVLIEGDENLLAHATEYYSELFGPALESNIHLDNNIWEGAAVLSETDNQQLCKPFSESEIWDALVPMEKNKAAGPDNFPIEFYQACWSIIKRDMVQLFDDFHQGKVDISRINYGIITIAKSDRCCEDPAVQTNLSSQLSVQTNNQNSDN